MSREPAITLEDLELLAAFVDGRLSGDEKQGVEARLAAEGDFYGLYVDTLHSLDEVEAEPAGAEVESDAPSGDETRRAEIIEHPASARWRTAVLVAGLAAAAMLAIAVLPRIFDSNGGDTMVAQLAAGGLSASERFGADWTDPGWSRTRSAGADLAHRIGPSGVAGRLGIRSVDLEVALRSTTDSTAATLARELAALADAGGVSAAAQVFQTLAAELEEDGIASEAALETAFRGTDLLADGLEAAGRQAVFDLGRWAEIGRLASLAGDEDLLEIDAFRDAAAVDRAGLPGALTEAFDRTLDDLRQPESGTDVLPSDFTALVRAIAG